MQKDYKITDTEVIPPSSGEFMQLWRFVNLCEKSGFTNYEIKDGTLKMTKRTIGSDRIS